MEIRQKYKGAGRFRIPEPWYKKTTGQPWDRTEVNWLTDNKYCRLVMAALAEGPKTKKELENIYVTLAPRLAKRKDRVKIFISPTAIQNHLDNLVWYGLVSKDKSEYSLNLPVLKIGQGKALDQISQRLAQGLAKAISESRKEIVGAAGDFAGFEQIVDPLLQRIAEDALEELEQQDQISYEWETFHSWIEEFDIEKFRAWALKTNKK